MLLYLVGFGETNGAAFNRHFRQVQRSLPIDQADAWELDIPGRFHLLVSGLASQPGSFHESPERVTFVDGCPFTNSPDLPDAEHIASLGEHPEEKLDGEYVLFDLNRTTGRVVITTDAMGQRPAFVYRDARATFISNSVRLLTLFKNRHELCPEAIAMLLNADYISRPHTLERDVTWLEPGTRYVASSGDSLVSKEPYFSLTRLLQDRNAIRKEGRTRDVSAFIDQSKNMFAALAASERTAYVATSGGMDSRVVGSTALEVADQLIFWANGLKGEPDIETAGELTRRWGVKLLRSEFADLDTNVDWRAHASEFLNRSDGLSNLSQMFANIGRIATGVMATPVHQGPGVPVVVTGNGADLARESTLPAHFWLRLKQGVSPLDRMLEKQINRHPAPRQVAREMCGLQFRDRLESTLDIGFSIEDMVHVRYLIERIMGWQANNRVALVKGADYMAAFHTREYMTRAFALSFLDRSRAILHYNTLRELSPEALDLEFAGRRPGGNRIMIVASQLFGRITRSRFKKTSGPPVGQAQTQWIDWMSFALPELGAQILDSSPDLIWDLIDRSKVEEILRTAQDRLTRSPAIFLFNLANVVLYDELIRENLQASAHAGEDPNEHHQNTVNG